MSSPRPSVVIVGGNFAGLVAASRLSCDYDVTVVDARTDFEWTPNIHEILSGVKTRQGVLLSRAECVGRYGHNFVHDTVTRIDCDANTVCTASGLMLPYDACLIAAGSQRTSFGVAGADEHSVGLRLADDAVQMAARLDKLARRKRRASVVVVGGGVSGVEAVGEILRRRARGDEFNVHLVESASRLLPQQPTALADDVVRRCEPYNVHIHTNEAVTSVDARHVTLASGATLSADLCIWSAGMTLPDFLRDAELGSDTDDWLPVDQTLQSNYADNIFVAGDCAALPEPLRKQAYYAMDTGEVAGDNIGRFLEGRALRKFKAANTPMLIAFGDITTWLVAGDYVVASPLLAAAKEGVYQATLARLASPRKPVEYAAGVVGRALSATERLLVPQLTPRGFLSVLTGSRIIT